MAIIVDEVVVVKETENVLVFAMAEEGTLLLVVFEELKTILCGAPLTVIPLYIRLQLQVVQLSSCKLMQRHWNSSI